MEVEKIMQALEQKHPGEAEYLQAVREVLESIKDVYNQHPEFEKAKIVERIVEPERIITFRVPWVDDKGEVQVNLGYRVQFNSAIGPYKGGLRFNAAHLSVLRIEYNPYRQNSRNAASCVKTSMGNTFDVPKRKLFILVRTDRRQYHNALPARISSADTVRKVQKHTAHYYDRLRILCLH